LGDRNADDLTDSPIEWRDIAIAEQKLHLTGSYQDSFSKDCQLTLSTGIDLANEHTLRLSPLDIAGESLANHENSQLEIDLGTDVKIAKLAIESEQILCVGDIKVNN